MARGPSCSGALRWQVSPPRRSMHACERVLVDEGVREAPLYPSFAPWVWRPGAGSEEMRRGRELLEVCDRGVEAERGVVVIEAGEAQICGSACCLESAASLVLVGVCSQRVIQADAGNAQVDRGVDGRAEHSLGR